MLLTDSLTLASTLCWYSFYWPVSR